MPKPMKLTEPTVGRLELTEPTVRRLEPSKVAAALGAEPTGDRVPAAGPVTLYALRTELYRRRQSSGGRPGIAGTDQRVKVPVSDRDWVRLEALATELSGPGASPSAGQVASILLSLALDSVKPTTGPGSERPDPALAQKLADKVASQT